MALPAVPLAISFVAFTLALIYYRRSKKQVKRSVIAILGPRGSGKTTLATFLAKGEIVMPEETDVRSSGKVNVDGWLLDHGRKEYISYDVSGSSHAHSTWKTPFVEADAVLYLFGITDLLENSYGALKRLNLDFSLFQEWLKAAEDKPQKKIIMLLTKADQAQGDRHKILDDVLSHGSILRARSYVGNDRFVLVIGSLANKKSAKQLVADAFKDSGL